MWTSFVLTLLAAAAAAVAAAVAWGAGAVAPAAIVVLLLRMALDARSGVRLIDALKRDTLADVMSRGGGTWGEVAHRLAKLLRLREDQMRQSQERLQEFLVALENSPNGVVLLDEQARIEWCNQTAAQHFAFDAQRDRLQHVTHLIRDPAFSGYLASWNYSRELVMSVTRSTAGPRKLAVQAHPYAGNRRLLLSRDVTAVEQAEAMRRDFVANVSHEIRTPLTVLAGFVETLQTLQLTDAERSRYLDLMAQQSQRMQTLVSDLLTLSRLEGSPAPGLMEWNPLPLLMERCEAEARSLSQVMTQGQDQGEGQGQGHDLRFAPTPDVELAGAGSELQSAMSNLLSNAIRYTPAGGRIEVSWTLHADGRAEYRVRDSGPGISPEHLGRLTERFYRVDRSRSRETGGTGLGLAIVKHVVQRHGGELRIDSVLGQGSSFGFVMPASRVRRFTRATAAATPESA